MDIKELYQELNSRKKKELLSKLSKITKLSISTIKIYLNYKTYPSKVDIDSAKLIAKAVNIPFVHCFENLFNLKANGKRNSN